MTINCCGYPKQESIERGCGSASSHEVLNREEEGCSLSQGWKIEGIPQMQT